jgi:hypothetical protein
MLFSMHRKLCIKEDYFMEHPIPNIVESLYPYFVTEPNPQLWPEYLKKGPIQGHGMWSFYQGLQLGLQLASACLETL